MKHIELYFQYKFIARISSQMPSNEQQLNNCAALKVECKCHCSHTL